MSVSVIDPVSPALAWTGRLLFRPFDFVKWLAIGFCAWLAYLGQGGGNFNIRLPGNHRGSGFAEAENWIRANMELVITLAVALVALGVVLGLLVMWLSSRGKFMFLDNVARNRAEIREPWGRFREQGNSLFLFRLVFGIVGFLLIVLLVGITALMLWGSISARTLLPMGIAGIVVGVTGIAILSVVLGCIGLALEDFVVPLMYLRGCRAMAAWREFRTLLDAHLGTFILYVLFKIVIAIAIGGIACLATFLTCCIAAFPYVGTVILLPVFVFLRSYSLYFLAQFGPDYRMVPDPDALAGQVVS